ncbi:MAG: hypothetical protein ACPGMQ_03180 [Pirellulales bacterium]
MIYHESRGTQHVRQNRLA